MATKLLDRVAYTGRYYAEIPGTPVPGSPVNDGYRPALVSFRGAYPMKTMYGADVVINDRTALLIQGTDPDM